ncbi:hypothetical protein CDV31_016594, partial [Fusarium ambrosium]
MDSFPSAISAFLSFAFTQAVTFLFQLDPGTDKALFSNLDLISELRNICLAHSLIQDALENNADEVSSDVLEDLVLYTNSVRKCSAIAQHLRLQNDPRFLKDARVISRQHELLRQARKARECSEQLQYRLDKQGSLARKLSVESEDVQKWLGASLFPNNSQTGPLLVSEPFGTPVIFHKWLFQDQKLIWCTSASDGSGEDLGLAVARYLVSQTHGDFLGYTLFSPSSEQPELSEPLFRLLRQLVASPKLRLSV